MCKNRIANIFYVLNLIQHIVDAVHTKPKQGMRLRAHHTTPSGQCDNLCRDLPSNDKEPVCMIYSRYKKGYQFFVNLCHARRAICRDNLVLHMVHSSRCIKNKQYYMPIN
ncbi:uncharacterized protein LOC123703506 [Colias croceus]|uniref:uncharacterized protein LOC123703506 n=1 Tax=Colias crocea TaxID=72248 RepID=UPI001E27B631|nr:uncharacterized protein LOC123703506 [Colias croceus]